MPSSAVTQLLLEWRSGDQEALDKLTPIVYQELRQLAHSYMRNERSDHALQSTALVHEAYIRLVGMDMSWEGRGHFFAVAAQLMRRILVDFARQRSAAKRGGDQEKISLDDVEQMAPEPAAELVALDDALKSLASFDPRKSRIVELRFFAGMTIGETAEVLGVSHATVERDLKMAKAWLSQEMKPGEG